MMDRYGCCDLLDTAECRRSYKDYFFSYYRSLLECPSTEMTRKQLAWYRKLIPLLQLTPGSNILDFGGGYGLDSIFLAMCGYRVYFYERTSHHIAICKCLKKNVEKEIGPLSIETVLAGEGEDIWAGSMDAVVMNEVAHHIEPPGKAFEKCYHFLRPSGHFFLIEPNFFSPISQLYFLRVRGLKVVLKKTDPATGQAYLVGNEHLRSPFMWRAIAAKAGLRLCETTYVFSYQPGPACAWERTVAAVATSSPLKHLLATHMIYRFQKPLHRAAISS